jgi:hypothetical protein
MPLDGGLMAEGAGDCKGTFPALFEPHNASRRNHNTQVSQDVLQHDRDDFLFPIESKEFAYVYVQFEFYPS